jgi:uncharacterized protein (TIGR03067 family)
MRIALVTLFFTLGLIAIGGTVARADDKADIEKELKKLEGAWTFESVEVGGNKTTADQFKGMAVVFKGDKYSVKVGDKVVEAATQKIDPSKSPKTLDSKVTDGPNKGKVYLCIYEISGDTLKVCFDPEGKKRPATFKGESGSQTLVVHKRVKK